MRYVNLNNFEFTKSRFFVSHRVEKKILYQNPIFFFFFLKVPLRKIFRFEKNIPSRNIPDSAVEFRILGLPTYTVKSFIDSTLWRIIEKILSKLCILKFLVHSQATTKTPIIKRQLSHKSQSSKTFNLFDNNE